MTVNAKIKKAKYVHLMFNDKFNKPFVDFLNRNFNQKEHLILCKNFYDFPFPEGKNVIELKYLARLKFDKVQKLICHSLFDNEVVEYLYKHPDILKNKAYWVMWGGDLYDAVRDEKNDFVRSNFKGYLLFADDERNILINKYQINNGKFFPVEYPLRLDISNIKSSKTDTINIQINNSCDKTIFEMLDILSKYREENIKIFVILSYGDLEYKEKIIEKGKDIFGEKFEYLDKMLPPEEYAKYIAKTDIFIANQNRQQATANIDMFLYFGKKVFIKSDVPTFKMYSSLGYKIYDTYLIGKQTFNDFIKQEENTNTEKAKYYISDEYRKKLWESIFND